MANPLLEIFETRQAAYKATFNNPTGQRVLKDLAEFCRADVSTFDPDPRVHALLEGRREVWLRVQKLLNLTPEQVAELRFHETNLRRRTNDE